MLLGNLFGGCMTVDDYLKTIPFEATRQANKKSIDELPFKIAEIVKVKAIERKGYGSTQTDGFAEASQASDQLEGWCHNHCTDNFVIFSGAEFCGFASKMDAASFKLEWGYR